MSLNIEKLTTYHQTVFLFNQIINYNKTPKVKHYTSMNQFNKILKQLKRNSSKKHRKMKKLKNKLFSDSHQPETA
jgi:hypothetical protein